jgi:type III restriction enzyme
VVVRQRREGGPDRVPLG